MTRGAGIRKPRQPDRVIKDDIGQWTDKQISDFIRKQFPLNDKFGQHCGCDNCSFPEDRIRHDMCACRWCRQTMLAARWSAVLLHYWRGKSDSWIEAEYGWKPGTVGSVENREAHTIESGEPVERGNPEISVTRLADRRDNVLGEPAVRCPRVEVKLRVDGGGDGEKNR